MKSVLNVGIDIGSTTIKVVVLDKERQIVYKNYARHFSEIGAALHENLENLKKVVGEKTFSFALTGSAGMGIAQRIGLPFVQEVIACASAVKSLIPQTDTVVELGGEDAKITYFGEAPEQRMNGVCAGGTGSFIDQMGSLLSIFGFQPQFFAIQGVSQKEQSFWFSVTAPAWQGVALVLAAKAQRHSEGKSLTAHAYTA